MTSNSDRRSPNHVDSPVRGRLFLGRAMAGATGAKPDQSSTHATRSYGQSDWGGLGLVGGDSRTIHGQEGGRFPDASPLPSRVLSQDPKLPP